MTATCHPSSAFTSTNYIFMNSIIFIKRTTHYFTVQMCGTSKIKIPTINFYFFLVWYVACMHLACITLLLIIIIYYFVCMQGMHGHYVGKLQILVPNYHSRISVGPAVSFFVTEVGFNQFEVNSNSSVRRLTVMWWDSISNKKSTMKRVIVHSYHTRRNEHLKKVTPLDHNSSIDNGSPCGHLPLKQPTR